MGLRLPFAATPVVALSLGTVSLWLLGFCVFVLPGHTLGSHTDLFQFFNWINALDHGQAPHLDFHTPHGALAHYLPYWGYCLAGQYGGALEVASVLALGVILPCAVVALRRSVAVPLGLLILVALAALIVVPWNPGDGALVISQFLFYNRWCWAALGALFLFFPSVRPRTRSANRVRSGVFVEGLAVAVLLLFLFFTKMSYFAVGVAFVTIFGIALRRFLRPATIGLVGFLGATLSVQIWSGSVDDYIGDVVDAIKATGFFWTGSNSPFLLNVLASWPQYAALTIACAIAASGASLTRDDWILPPFVIAASVAIFAQNGAQACAFGLVAAFPILIESCRGVRRALVIGALFAFLLPALLAQGVAAFAFTTNQAHYAPVDLPRMEAVYFPRSKHHEIHRLQRGLALLERDDLANGGLMTFDFANWFPVFLDIPPVRGRLWCFHVGRSVSHETAPTTTAMFANVRFIMVPKFATIRLQLLLKSRLFDFTSVTQTSPRDFLLDIYGDFVAQTFVLVKENERWWLLRRVPEHGAK